MDERLHKLGEVGTTAACIFGEIEQLYAAVWQGPEASFPETLDERTPELAMSR
jgi:hypothetical protein